MDVPALVQAFTEHHPVLAQHFPFLLVFALLYLSGLGLPLPEEFSLVLGGYLMYLLQSDNDPTNDIRWGLGRMIATASAAILAGDLTVYALGRRYGQALLDHRWIQKVLSRQNRGRIDRFYDRWGHWAVFFSRFVAGIRVGAFFLAGAHGVRARTFLLMDGLGTLISVPVSIWLAWHFGEEIHQTLSWLGAIFRNLVYLVAIVSLSMLWWQIRRARRTAGPAP